MAKETSNLIYIIGLLYSLIIIGIVMYIISKASEETVDATILKTKVLIGQHLNKMIQMELMKIFLLVKKLHIMVRVNRRCRIYQ